jgi:hypothetical protein
MGFFLLGLLQGVHWLLKFRGTSTPLCATYLVQEKSCAESSTVNKGLILLARRESHKAGG